MLMSPGFAHAQSAIVVETPQFMAYRDGGYQEHPKEDVARALM
jgi:hypothetical protein